MLSLATLKTPGVYIDEVSKFPPSIAAVETAIPAFIGYTEKAKEEKTDDLKNKPKRIGSLAEFEQFYGSTFKPIINKITIDSANQLEKTEHTKQFYMYDALRMFYANGGGDCYIISVGSYSDTIDKSHFLDSSKGLKALEKYDEPTIILFPDAVLLENNGLYEVQIEALKQCGTLQDRIALFDLKKEDYLGKAFRSQIGINNLKYGIAYSSWLRTNINKGLSYSDIKDKLNKGGAITKFENLTNDVLVKQCLLDLDTVIADATEIETRTNTLAGGAIETLSTAFLKKTDVYLKTKTSANLQAIFKYLYDIALTIEGLKILSNSDLKISVNTVVSSVQDIYKDLASTEELATTVGDFSLITGYTKQYPTTLPLNTWLAFTGVTASGNPIVGVNAIEKMDSLIGKLETAFSQINDLYQTAIKNTAVQLEKNKNASLLTIFPLYKSIINSINDVAIPPSGAVAGLYAYVDNTRGVWKAPANVSISSVIPDYIFSNSELDALNVDVVSGKSINAIRSFSGKGTLVFGARTLAGNDPEWRYVSVRRFFNMVEESCKKATEQFVFEPNDANTWVRVQSMIDNFLWTLWRDGALQGATPQKAYYVSVGLGKTMTALDILDGRMIVEIGLAAVRPAEFIVLRFSHKLPEA